jgi:hypothetical protein
LLRNHILPLGFYHFLFVFFCEDMPRYALSSLLVIAATTSIVYAQGTTTSITPLASLHIPYNQIPYQVDPNDGVRGPQQGYNICNSTTENQNSLCQTSYLNTLDDFCLWAPPIPNSTIGDTEGEEVAWCTKPGRGTRVIPPGALKGVQFMRTSAYVQVVGFIDQTLINLNAEDFGGELDPHGADLRGNPLGGLVYSTAWSSDNTTFEQVIEWHNFMGGSVFCFKVCDPAGANAANYCQHIYDRIGCAYNAPNNAQNGSFTSCDGDVQDFPGIYTASDGSIQTYTQPAESLGAISTMPYQPKVPASSNCVTFTSAALYASAASDTVFPSSTSTPSGSSSRTSGSGASPTAGSGSSSGAATLVASTMTTILGIAFAVAFFA